MASDEARNLTSTNPSALSLPTGHELVDQDTTQQHQSSTPVEMSQSSSTAPADIAHSLTNTIKPGPYIPQSQSDSLQQQNPSQLAPPTTTSAIATASTTSHIPQAPEPAALPGQIAPHIPQHARTESSAIGPSSEGPIVTSAEPQTGPTVLITLLLLTGARHPYTIDQRYLKRRNVAAATEDVDPFEISVYTLKELIWRDWREEWEPRPSSPSAIRLIHFGKLLDDKSSLRDCRFQPATPNVVHMTIKPQEVVEEEENAKSGKAHSGRERRVSDAADAGCRCCIIQ